MTDIPIACTLSEADLRRRQEEIRRSLTARATAAGRSDGGVFFEFEADGATLATIAAVVDAERRCCPFLSFSVAVPAGFGPIRLEISGPREAEDAISTFFPTS